MARNGTFAAFVLSRGAFFTLIAAAVLVAGVPVLLSIVAPQLNNSVVITICASGQFFVSIFAGIAWSKAQAVKEANLRWVPMAASACDRLATILGSVVNLRATVGQACGNATKNIPELLLENNRAVRIHFEGLCSSNATRLNDVESHLDSALTDWERFIKHNCDGPECADIGRRLAILRARLSTANCVPGLVGCNSNTADASLIAKHSPIIAEKLDLMVSGVTTEQKRNGRWVLTQIVDGIWECEMYILRKESHGWYIEDRSDSASYFYRAEMANPCGVYERCEVCPHDGNAVVFKPVNPAPKSHEGDPTQVALSLPALKVDPSQVLNMTIALSDYLQHIVRDHGISQELLITAVTESSDLAEFSAMVGAECPGVVSVCAIPALNVMRASLGRPAFSFDEELHAKLTENADTDPGGVDEGMQASVKTDEHQVT